MYFFYVNKTANSVNQLCKIKNYILQIAMELSFSQIQILQNYFSKLMDGLIVFRNIFIICPIYFVLNQSYKQIIGLEEMKKNIISPFIELIWDIIQDPISDHIICWSPNGTSFYITDPQAFSTDILSRYFKHANLSSFVRQLNMYNFHKNKNNTRQLEFFHKLFRRDAKQILIGIKRKPSQADQRQGQELLKKFLNRNYSFPTQIKDQKQSDHYEQDKGSQNTTVEAFYRKISILSEQSDRSMPILQFPIYTPRKILNIILITKPQQI